MSYITPGQLAHERVITTPALSDTMQRLTFTAGSSVYATGASYPCSFQGRVNRDVMPGADVPVIDADLYLAHTATLNEHDRVRITHLYGEAQALPLTYAVIGGPLLDGLVKHAMLRLVVE